MITVITRDTQVLEGTNRQCILGFNFMFIGRITNLVDKSKLSLKPDLPTHVFFFVVSLHTYIVLHSELERASIRV